jgi:hypothetical protein
MRRHALTLAATRSAIAFALTDASNAVVTTICPGLAYTVQVTIAKPHAVDPNMQTQLLTSSLQRRSRSRKTGTRC